VKDREARPTGAEEREAMSMAAALEALPAGMEEAIIEAMVLADLLAGRE
jgi:hypothetical protein